MRFFTLIFFYFIVQFAFSQGKILLIGGGSESSASNSWSNLPYQWAIDESTNKKVAIISDDHSNSDNWLPNYFVSLGASEAKNIEISSRSQADSQSTFDDLMTYDVLFLKGGDQSDYYDLYVNTKVAEALSSKYDEGGVLAGTSAGLAILSGVTFTAQGGIVYPDQALADIFDEDITLKNDFVQVLPGILADSHFIERGRFGRLIPFLGRWFEDTNEKVLGLGVDDKTAVCIKNDEAIVYGSGATGFYYLSDFSNANGKPIVNQASATQLLHNQRFNLTSRELITEYAKDIEASQVEESGNYQIFLSGNDAYTDNTQMLAAFLTQANEPITVVTDLRNNKVDRFIEYLDDNGVEEYEILETSRTLEDCDAVLLRNHIRQSGSFLFLKNSSEDLMNFVANDETGHVLEKQLKQNENALAFIGQDSKLAGKTFCNNNLENDLNAFRGDLAFSDGLKLLETTIVMPHTFSSETVDFYENNSAAALYAITDQKLGYGIYLNENSYAHFYQNENTNYLTSSGEHSSILIKNTASKGDFANQAANNSGDIRQVVGFDEVTYSLISGQSIEMGNTVNAQVEPQELELYPAENLEVSRTESGIKLSWKAISDENREGFRIFRKELASGFSQLAEVSAQTLDYIDEDVNSENQYAYYLVAFNDSGASCRTSEVISQAVLSVNDTQQPYPNPVISGGIIRIENRPIKNIQLIDMKGNSYSVVKLGNEIEIRLPKVKSGVYLLKYSRNKIKKTVRLRIE